MNRLSGEDKAGLYITVIVHLTVIIVLLLFRIGAVLKEENSFVLDFTREEALERMAEKDRAEKAKEEFSDEIINLHLLAVNLYGNKADRESCFALIF